MANFRRLNDDQTDDLTISQRRDFLEVINNDIFFEIFSRLSVKSIARCRCVSKLWGSALGNQVFTDSFLKRSYSQPKLLFTVYKEGTMFFFSAENSNSPQVTAYKHLNLSFDDIHNGNSEFVGSVNGLLCSTHLWMFNGRPVTIPVINNTSTGQTLSLLPQVRTYKVGSFDVKSFFAYDPIENQFKMLCMTTPRYSSFEVNRITEEHQVLTLGTENPCWRMVPYSRNHYPVSNGVCIDGFLYYVAVVVRLSFLVGRLSSVAFIVCFNVRSEKFRFIKKSEDMAFLKDTTLVNYKGKLAAVRALLSIGLDGFLLDRVGGGTRGIEMCVLEDREKTVWSKHVYEFPSMWKTIVGDDKLYFVGVAGTNEIVLAPRYLSDRFFVYYIDTERIGVRRVEVGGMGAFKDCKVHTAQYVENVKFMEMFETVNLRPPM